MGRQPGGYEAARAREVAAIVGATDLCVDLHTTTSNMGCTLIVGAWCPAAIRAAAYVSEQWSRAAGDGGGGGATDACGGAEGFPVRVLIDEQYSQAECPYLCSVGRHGLEIEVGATPQGLLRADVVAATERALELTLEYFERVNAGRPPPIPATLPAFLDKGKLPWPAAPGSVLPDAIVHPQLQGRDFETLRRGDPLWLGLDGSVTAYDGACGEAVVPIFINEAAYYHAGSGMGVGLCEPVEWRIEAADDARTTPSGRHRPAGHAALRGSTEAHAQRGGGERGDAPEAESSRTTKKAVRRSS